MNSKYIGITKAKNVQNMIQRKPDTINMISHEKSET
jgi:hypothetical protein